MSEEDLTREEIDLYLGDKTKKILRMLTTEEWDRFQNLNIDIEGHKSYIVEGCRANLKKFEAYYLFRCSFAKPLVAKYMLSDYIRSLLSKDEEEFIEKDIMILYSHAHSFGIGNTETLYLTTILEKIATRARRNGVTIILSERDFPMLEQAEELELLRLDDTIKHVCPFIPAPKTVVVQKYSNNGGGSYDSSRSNKKKVKDEDYVSESSYVGHSETPKLSQEIDTSKRDKFKKIQEEKSEDGQ